MDGFRYPVFAVDTPLFWVGLARLLVRSTVRQVDDPEAWLKATRLLLEIGDAKVKKDALAGADRALSERPCNCEECKELYVGSQMALHLLPAAQEAFLKALAEALTRRLKRMLQRRKRGGR